MSLRANRQRCGIPSTSKAFILQLGLMWSSFTSLPSDLSSTDASRLKEKNTDVKSRSNLLCLDTVLMGTFYLTVEQVIEVACSNIHLQYYWGGEPLA